MMGVRSFCVFIGVLLGYFEPLGFVGLKEFGGVGVEGVVLAGGHQHRFYFLHHGHQLLGGGPLGASLDHVLADLSLLVDVGVVDWCLEGDRGGLEGEVVQLELHLELSALVGGSLGSAQEDRPDQVVRVHDVVPKWTNAYYFSSSCLSLFSLGALINQQIFLY